MGLVKTRRLAAMQKQQRAIRLRQGYGALNLKIAVDGKDVFACQLRLAG